MTGSRKTLILGCASTGAKFTPRNHAATGDRLLDSICTGATIRTAPANCWTKRASSTRWVAATTTITRATR